MRKPVLKRHKISQKDIAKWFGFSSEFTFNSSTAKDRYLKGIEKIIERVEQSINEKIENALRN